MYLNFQFALQKSLNFGMIAGKCFFLFHFFVQKTLDSTAEKFTRTLDETAATLKKAINEKENQVCLQKCMFNVTLKKI